MVVIGIDLAGKETNPTGICILNNKEIRTYIRHSDEEIVSTVNKEQPEIVAIDAPLSTGIRLCDKMLREYGVLPANYPGMNTLAERGMRIAKRLENFNVIEVSVEVTRRLLGFVEKEPIKIQKKLVEMGFSGDVVVKKLSADEIDAILCAITGELHILGKTKEIGNKKDRIVVPDVNI
jgi:predicted nuclease with RNAse H fold